jgi:hypothetical protein
MKKTFIHTVVCSLLVAMIATTTGCAGLIGDKSTGKPLSKRMPWSKDKDKPEPYPNPTRIAATWTPDTLVQTGRTPTRGFGGRLFFYDEKTKPVPVDGELTVHAFAESATGDQGEVKRYHFTAEQFTAHFSQTDIGASYSVWIPWDAVGGEQTRVSLVPSFRAANGRMVQGEQAIVALPGRRKTVENIATRPNAASIMEATRDASKSGLVTTTIPVRSTLTRAVNSLPAPVPANIPTSSIAAVPPKTQSFDVAPLGLSPMNANQQASNLSTVAAATTPIAPVQSPALTSAEARRTSVQATPLAPRPLRLGKGTSQAGTDVIHASANLPLE